MPGRPREFSLQLDLESQFHKIKKNSKKIKVPWQKADKKLEDGAEAPRADDPGERP